MQDELTLLRNTVADLSTQLQEVESQKHQLEQLFQDQNENLRDLHSQHNNHLQHQLDRLIHERQALKQDNQTLRQKLMIEINLRKKSELLYEDLKNKLAQITDNQDLAQSKLSQKQDEAKHLAMHSEQLKLEIGVQKKKITHLEDHIDNLKVELDVAKGQNDQMKDDALRNKEKLKVFGQENAKLRQEIEILVQQREKASSLIEEYKQ